VGAGVGGFVVVFAVVVAFVVLLVVAFVVLLVVVVGCDVVVVVVAAFVVLVDAVVFGAVDVVVGFVYVFDAVVVVFDALLEAVDGGFVYDGVGCGVGLAVVAVVAVVATQLCGGRVVGFAVEPSVHSTPLSRRWPIGEPDDNLSEPSSFRNESTSSWRAPSGGMPPYIVQMSVMLQPLTSTQKLCCEKQSLR